MGSKQKREVWDYLASVQYGICHGPIDSVNAIWVKDKRILCDTITRREDREIDQPDLFGGDDAEGGVGGVIECYMGTDTQVASEALALRFGRTPATMPGYRGLAHLFFRGDSDGRGFKWASMNPYQPSAEASVTRISRTLSPLYASIPATIGVDGGGNLLSVEASTSTTPSAFGTGSQFPTYQTGGFSVGGPFAEPHLASEMDFGEAGLSVAQAEALAARGEFPYVRWRWELGAIDSFEDAISLDYEIEVRAYDRTGQQIGSTGDTGTVYEAVTILESAAPLPNGTTRVTVRGWYYPAGSGSISAMRNVASYSMGFGEPLESLGSVPVYDFVPGIDTRPAAEHDLLALGWNEYSIDSGLVQCLAVTQAYARFYGLGGTGSAEYSFTLELRFYGAKDDGTIDYNNLVGSGIPADGVISTSARTVDGYLDRDGTLFVIPSGARFMAARAFRALLLPLFSQFLDSDASLQFIGPRAEPLHCLTDGTGLNRLPDANPAHIIHEVLVNEEWGKGEDPALIDTESFLSAAATLYAERFGLSLQWVNQTDIDSFVQEILDHISAVLFQHPATGLWTLVLLRDDYDSGALKVLDPTNCTISNMKRRAWGETINEITVSYTDPEKEADATVTSHNLGNIAVQGGVVGETRDYYAIRNPYLAKIVADRDVREAGYPLFTCQVKVNRSAWQTTPGSVRRLSWPEEGIENMVVRVLEVDYGTPADREITLNLAEDIFSLEKSEYGAPQGSENSTEADLPAPFDMQFAATAPYAVMVAEGYTDAEITESEGQVRAMLFAASETQNPLGVKVWSEVALANGSVAPSEVASFPLPGSATLAEALGPEVVSLLPESLVRDVLGSNPQPGDLLMLGTSEAVSEIVMLDRRVTLPARWYVIRGIWDTVPRDWPTGSWVLALNGGSSLDSTTLAAGDNLSYRFLMRTGYGTLSYNLAADVPFQPTNRPRLPTRPADAQLDGAGFTGVSYKDSATRPTSVTASWAIRNRTYEDLTALRWIEGSVTPEVGQTTTLRVLNLDGTERSRIESLTGTTYDVPIAALRAVGKGYVEFLAARAGQESLMGARRAFDVAEGGYGNGYGFDYGQ